MTTASTLEYALLGLLQQSPQAGYDLRKTFANTPMRHFSDSPGSIYPALRRLESRGWVVPKVEPGHNARKRQAYRITAGGKSALLEWLRAPVGREEVIHKLEELKLRFAFLGENVSREEMLAFTAQMQEALESYIRELRHYYKNFGPGIGSITGRLAFESGILSYEATLNWLRKARKELEKQS
ncbi:MAG TPA: helix-turn-helix transcriptional regulator [Terriglobales bacterium]|nr:helix-turn-helix transcriptional regulator [Terriglobales bacterium]